MDENVSQAERLDRIRANLTAGLISRDEAIEGVKATFGVPDVGADTVPMTDVGAADILDDPRSAVDRYRKS